MPIPTSTGSLSARPYGFTPNDAARRNASRAVRECAPKQGHVSRVVPLAPPFARCSNSRPRAMKHADAPQSLRLIGASVAEARGDAIGGGHEVWAERVDELL